MADEIAKRWASLPIVYEAMLLTTENAAEVAEWIGGSVVDSYLGDWVQVSTPSGELQARPGDMVYRNDNCVGHMKFSDWLQRHEPTV